jgi:putative holliday junction resolvase
MAFLGIDYGSKRVGVSVSDPEGKMAFPNSVIMNDFPDHQILIEKIIQIAKEKESKTIILGESKDFKGNDNPIMFQVKKLKSELESNGFKVIYEPEYMTTQQASRIQGENSMTDAGAATILLQSFLDKSNNLKEEVKN